jgi:hypothetical protein
MNPACFLALAVVSSVAAHAVIRHTVPKFNSVLAAMVVSIPCGLGLAFLVGTKRSWFGPEWLGVMLLYGFAMELYVFLFTMVLSSVSVSLLLSRNTRQDEVASSRELSGRQMFDNRLIALQQSGFIVSANDSYMLTPVGVRTVKLVGALRSFFGHTAG